MDTWKPSSSTPCAPRSGSARVRSPGGIPPICSGLVLRTHDRAQRLRSRASSTTSSVAASPSRVSRAATSPATRGSRPGLPWHVPATSVDRQCGSSQQAVHFVAQGVIAGAYDIGIACGVESMTRAPMSSNARGGTGPFSPAFLREHEQHARHPVLGRAGARRPVGHHARGDGRVRAREPPARARGEHRQRLLRPARSCPCRSRTRTARRPARCSPPTRGSGAGRTMEKPRHRSRPRGSPRTSPRPTSPPATRRR